ncbi:hypothetical protein RSAG8_12191, partial [Rhizoctonia solani AG-8 WAC10335]
MIASLDYPVTRRYPWRWTTLTVCLFAGLVLIALGFFNFAAVGYTTQSAYYDEFMTSAGMNWRNKLNVKYTQASSIECDPSNIALGGTYRTNNAIFALNVGNLRDPITSAPLGSVAYSGDVLDNCRVDRIHMIAEYTTQEVKYRAQVSCRSPSLFVNFTVDSVVTMRAGVQNGIINLDTLGRIDNEESRYEAVVTSVLYAFGLDVFASVFFSAPLMPSRTSLGKKARIFEAQGVSTVSRTAMQNFAIALQSAILVDVGSTVTPELGYNIFNNVSALRASIHAEQLVGTNMTRIIGSTNRLSLAVPVTPYLLSNPGDFQLPITARQPGDSNSARLVQRYLCHRLVLKPIATLIVDVLVATISMFMAGWGVAMTVLMYVAKEYSLNG